MIKLEHVSHAFTDHVHHKRILFDINIAIKPKEIFGLVGKTGSGKSTCLRIMNGFIDATEGDVFLLGEKLTKKNKHDLVKQTSMVFQGFNLLANLSVMDNVLLPSKLRKEELVQSKKEALDFLSFVGLEGYENRRINTLSGGQKQRVAIARTLMSHPKIIFCDEPTSALDDQMRNDVLALLRKINETMGTTIVLVSHDIAVIKALCHRVAILNEGKVEEVIALKQSTLSSFSYKEALLDDA